MFVDLVWLAEFLRLVGEIKAVYDALAALAAGEPTPPEVVPLTDEERLQVLKDCTLLVASLRLNLACYPLTASAVLFVDEDGAWVG